jgi:hypothetical protein
MQAVTELIVRVADLCEAEGRTLRGVTLRLALGIVIILIAAAASIAGLILLVLALYITVEQQAGQAAAALLTGGAVLAIGVLLAWLVYRTAK